MSADPTEVTLGEVARGLARVEQEMQAMRAEIKGLAFVPAAVYAVDMVAYRDRVERVERDLVDETAQRRTAEATAQQRAWQAKWSIVVALIGMPISVIGALIIAALK